MPPSALATLAQGVLDAVEAAAAQHSVTLPDRRYISPGQVAWDCEQLVVQVPRIPRGVGTQERLVPVDAADLFFADFTIWLVRCTPAVREDGTAPTAASLTTSAEEILADGWLLTIGLLPHLKTLAGSCRDLAVGAAQGAGPEGGFAGWTVPVQIGL